MSTKSFLAILVMDYQDNGGEDIVSEIPIDVCKSRTPRYLAEVTRFPVEAGYSITDNRRIDPDEYEIEGIISDTPVESIESTQGELRGDGTVASASTAPAATLSAHEAWRGLHEAGTLVTIVDQYRQCKDMVLTSLIFPRTKDTGNALEFQATFSKLRIVSTSAVALPADVLKRVNSKRPKVSSSAKISKLRAQLMKQVAAGKMSPEAMKTQLDAASKVTAAKTPRAA